MNLRASSLGRLEACPASHWLAQLAPPAPDSDDAESGTAIHAALAGEHPLRPLTVAEEDVADLCREIVAGFYEDLPEERFRELELEESFAFGTLTGHCDLVEIRDSRALVVDYKTGRDPVAYAEDNIQLLAYALMVKAQFPGIDEIDLAIVQPLAPGRGSRAIIGVRELAHAWERIRDVFAAVRDAKANPVPIPSEEACKYCPALAICPAHRQTIAAVSVADSAPARWGLATRDEKLALWHQMRAAKKAIAALEWLFRQDLEADGNAFGGAIYIGKGRTQREIVDAPGLFGALRSIGVTGEEFAACCRVSIGDLETLVRAKTGLKGKGLTERFAQLIRGFVEPKTTKGSLETA